VLDWSLTEASWTDPSRLFALLETLIPQIRASDTVAVHGHVPLGWYFNYALKRRAIAFLPWCVTRWRSLSPTSTCRNNKQEQYSSWRRQEFGVTSCSRLNESRKFLHLATLTSPQAERVLRLTEEDRKLYGKIQGYLTNAPGPIDHWR
jgi:hypothetical protein